MKSIAELLVVRSIVGAIGKLSVPSCFPQGSAYDNKYSDLNNNS